MIDGDEIVRYDKAGKWYLEMGRHGRIRLNVRKAAELAAEGEWIPGLPGGRRFDLEVKRIKTLWK